MNPGTVIAIIVFVPAGILLYGVLGEFENYFMDNKAFFMLILGMALGLIIGIFSNYFPIDQFIWNLGIISLMEVIKFFILLQKPFRKNYDTTFYGAALGMGMGVMMVFVLASWMAVWSDLANLAPTTALFIFLLSFNYTIINGSTGAIIGYGSYKGEFWSYLIKAVILHGGHGFFITLSLGTFQPDSLMAPFSLLIVGLIYGIVLLFYVYNEILKETIPDEIRRKVEDSDG